MKSYIAIDLKSFYASVECRERGLNPLKTHLVVADASRTEKTICLAVTPSLKAYGISGRARLFEVVSRVKEINWARQANAPSHIFTAKSVDASSLAADSNLELDYIVAPPRMAYYMRYSAKIYEIYLRFVSEADIFSYSVDEVFIDATPYLKTYGLSARDLALLMVRTVFKETGITATAGIGTNLYLAKIAMDVKAKHMPADKDGVRIAELTEESFKQEMWSHKPITDFWRVGRGYATRLAALGAETMGDVARLSLTAPQKLFDQFGVNAELLIDHAWGWECVGIADIKAYSSDTHSRMSSQILAEPYETDKARLVAWEMADSLALELVEKGLVAHGLEVTVGYDVENLTDAKRKGRYRGSVVRDCYGRTIPKPTHGKEMFAVPTSSGKEFCDAVLRIFNRVADKTLLIRRLALAALDVVSEGSLPKKPTVVQPDLFAQIGDSVASSEQKEQALSRERRMQKAMLLIKERFGKNSLLKAKNFQDGATARERNSQVGGHKA